MIYSLFLFYPLVMMCAQPEHKPKYTLEQKKITLKETGETDIATILTNTETGLSLTMHSIYSPKRPSSFTFFNYIPIEETKMKRIFWHALGHFLGRPTPKPDQLAQTPESAMFHFNTKDLLEKKSVKLSNKSRDTL